MFKRSARLTRSEFSAFFATGKRHHSQYFTIITHPHPTLKVAVVVSKKVAKSAVRRNTLRRRVYAELRHVMKDSSFAGILIMIAKPNLATLPRKTAQAAIAAAVAQALKSA